MVMDESVDDLQSISDCSREAAADVVNIKISKFGGLTKAKQVGFVASFNAFILWNGEAVVYY
jgi:L-alanine-DL-glutamate epimerase-like enolase superfamily enzyme